MDRLPKLAGNASTPLVSVVIPTYNHAKFLPESLRSVIEQSFTSFEIIVVNDGSTDNTAELLEGWAAANRIRLIHQQNAGQSRARNRGIAEARGKYVAFLDDDDFWPADKLQWQVEFLEQNNSVGAVGGMVQSVDEQGRSMELGPFFESITFESLFRSNPFLSPGQLLVRADLLKSLGGMDVNIWGADDWDLWFKIARKTRIVMEKKVALYYRFHPNNSSRQSVRLLEGCCQAIRAHIGAIPVLRRRELRGAALLHLFNGLGRPIVASSRQQLGRLKPVSALKHLRGLRPFGWDLLRHPAMVAAAFDEFFLVSIRLRVNRVFRGFGAGTRAEVLAKPSKVDAAH